MKNVIAVISLFLFASCCSQEGKHPQGIEHVVVIGIDGMSSQGLREARTPFMDSLMANGAYSYKVRCVLPTSSKPNWNAMLCGAGPDITGVTSNGWYRDKYDLAPVVMTDNYSFPNIFRIIREQRPDAELGAIYHWDDFRSMLDDNIMNKSESYRGALETAQRTAEYIRGEKPDFLFIHLDDVDHYGHSHGHMSPAYIKSIEEADRQARIIVDAIHEAGIAGSTMVMIVSDHGGIFHGHGGNTYEELTTPIIFTGKGIKKGYEIQQQIYRYDVAADVAFALGVKAPQVWVGRPTLPAFEGFGEPDNLWKGVEVLPPPAFATETYNAPYGGSAVNKPATVTIKAPLGVEGVVRYTTDGSVPTRESTVYNGPFTVDAPTVVTAKLFNDKGESPKVVGTYNVTYTKTKR
jgi:predicted AlkP superfamily pyrophosphatase or phosphodiesterase